MRIFTADHCIKSTDMFSC